MTRRLRTAATLLVLLCVLTAGAYYGWKGLTTGWFDESTVASEDPSDSCSTPPAVTVRAKKVRVSVYNAGAPGGQATEVMEALVGQGFVRGELSDAPEQIDVKGVVIWPGKADTEAVKLVKAQFRKIRVIHRMKPIGPGINVLVGIDFGSLSPKAPRTLDVAQEPVCGQVS